MTLTHLEVSEWSHYFLCVLGHIWRISYSADDLWPLQFLTLLSDHKRICLWPQHQHIMIYFHNKLLQIALNSGDTPAFLRSRCMWGHRSLSERLQSFCRLKLLKCNGRKNKNLGMKTRSHTWRRHWHRCQESVLSQTHKHTHTAGRQPDVLSPDQLITECKPEALKEWHTNTQQSPIEGDQLSSWLRH